MDAVTEKIIRLYSTYGKRMYCEAYKYLNDKQLAEDALQQAFIKVIKYLNKIDEKNCPNTRGYLVIISRTTAIDMLKKKSKDYPTGIDFDNEIADEYTTEPSVMMLHKETVNELSEIIKELPHIYRDVFMLRIIQEHSRAEIADICGISVDAVDKRLSRAKKMIRKEYERRYGHE